MLVGWPLHWINLALWEGDANSVVVECSPDFLTQVTAHGASLQGIADRVLDFVVDRRLCKVDRESLGCGMLQDSWMLAGDLFEKCHHLLRFMVIGRTDNYFVSSVVFASCE